MAFVAGFGNTQILMLKPTILLVDTPLRPVQISHPSTTLTMDLKVSNLLLSNYVQHCATFVRLPMAVGGTPLASSGLGIPSASRIMMIVTVCYKIDTWAKAGGCWAPWGHGAGR